MELWMFYALLSMVFAGATSILAKYGMQNINPDLALAVRTSVIFALVLLLNYSAETFSGIPSLTTREILLLVLSGVATTLSWVFYYRAMKSGPVSYVAAIDKGSIVITMLLAFTLLKEPITPRILLGGGLIFFGMIVLVWK